MTRDDFLGKLQQLSDLGDNMKVLLYFVVKDSNTNRILKKANVQSAVLDDMAEGFRLSIADEIKRFEDDNERDVLDLSTRDERSNVVYRYDLLDEEPSFFEKMREAAANHPNDYFTGVKMFNFEQDNLSDIDYFVSVVGTEDCHIAIYRNKYNVNLLKRGIGKYFLNRSDTQFTQVSTDILRVDTQIDTMLMDDEFYVLNLSYLDKNQEFSSVIQKRAETSLQQIEQLNIVDDIAGLQDRLQDISFARRLMRAVDSSPVTDMPMNEVISFVAAHPKLKNVLKIENNMFKLSSKKAQDYFVRLLNDDFLHSLLTNKDYESMAKNRFK